MSTNNNNGQSERAVGRVGDLRESALNRLRAHDGLVALLEGTEAVADGEGASVIIPSPRFGVQAQSATDDAPGVALAVGVVTGSSERENLHERKNLVLQTTLLCRERTFKWMGDAWLDDVQDEVSAVLTANAPGWNAQGESGGTFEPLWDESINRYTSVQQFDVQRWD